jgi:EAL domain-containing protein (putative c-di-GMP-specific phosphodiesterase class I)
MTRAALSIARSFDLTPIVEGVETETQRDRLLRHGAILMQGYLFARPLTLQAACEFTTHFNQSDRRMIHA